MGTCPTRGQSNRTSLDNPQPESDVEDSVVVSLYNYPSFGNIPLSMHTGDRLTVLSDDGDFMMVRSAATRCDSYIPTTYTAKVTHRWMFTGISRHKAVELLLLPSNHNGAFLIRDSETNRGCHSLSVLWRTGSSHSDSVKHYRISHLHNGWVYISPGLTFPCLHQLVQHYSEQADGLCTRLTEPCHIYSCDDNTDSARPVPTAVTRPTVNWKDISRSVIFTSKRTKAENSLVSEGLREAISSYLQMTDSTTYSWDT